MYLYYTKEKDKVLVQNSNMNFDIFDNTNNIENILKVNNNIEFIEMKKKELHSMINEKTKEEIDIKLLYLDLLQEIQNKRLNKLINKSFRTFEEHKISNYITINDYIEDVNNKLKLVDFYLYIRNSIINHKELNIKFSEEENNRKELSFVNLCFNNIDDSTNFINSLIKKDGLYSIKNKQKKLKKV